MKVLLKDVCGFEKIFDVREPLPPRIYIPVPPPPMKRTEEIPAGCEIKQRRFEYYPVHNGLMPEYREVL